MRWNIWTLCMSLVLVSVTECSAGLIVGDLAIIGVNSDNPDEFAWVPFVDLNAGEEIFFTDAGWIDGRLGGNSGPSSDGILRFTAPAGGLSAGRVQVARLGALSDAYQSLTSPNLGRLSLSPAGDQLAAFTGFVDQPDFLFAVNLAASSWTTTSGSRSNAIRSGLYPGLQPGVSAVAVGLGPRSGDEVDNSRFEGITVGSARELLLAVADPDNWAGQNLAGSGDRFSDLGNGTTRFEITAETAKATVPEPASCLTWMIGIGFFAWIHRRCRLPLRGNAPGQR